MLSKGAEGCTARLRFSRRRRAASLQLAGAPQVHRSLSTCFSSALQQTFLPSYANPSPPTLPALLMHTLSGAGPASPILLCR